MLFNTSYIIISRNISIMLTDTDHHVTLKKLGDVILQLTEKIAGMENKIDELMSRMNHDAPPAVDKKKNLIYTPDYVPALDFDAWIQTCVITHEHVHAIFRNTNLEGFKYFIRDWFSQQIQSNVPLPLVVLGSGKTKFLYVFEVASDDGDNDSNGYPDGEKEEDGDKNGKWVLMSDRTLNQFIAAIWRKMLEFYFTCDNEDGVDETVRDINKKKLIDMRKGLTEKHGREIERFVVKILLGTTKLV